MKTLSITALLVTLCSQVHSIAAIYHPLREYAGPSFFDGWDFYGFYDNTTWGNVTFQDRANATSKRLAYVNDVGNAIVRVDNTSTVEDATLVYRDSIRITSTDAYGVGSLIVIDALHIPYGCSVWPSFWTLGVGAEWPNAGEIDIIESINQLPNNQIALHTTPGCFQAASPGQSGRTIGTDCATPQGCLVAETKPNSYGPNFAQAGGGVFAAQFDVSGVYVWFFSRPDIPANLKNAGSNDTLDTSTWGIPTAGYPAAGCNITQFFAPQKLVLLTTLCGVWAGVPDIYGSTCHTPTGSCVKDNIVGPGSPTYDNAFWEVRYIRTYLADGAFAAQPAVSSAPSTPSIDSGNTNTPVVTSTIVVKPSSSQTGGVLPATSASEARHSFIQWRTSMLLPLSTLLVSFLIGFFIL